MSQSYPIFTLYFCEYIEVIITVDLLFLSFHLLLLHLCVHLILLVFIVKPCLDCFNSSGSKQAP